MLVRTRACNGQTCGEWSAPSDSSLRYLTWSGGVTTRYVSRSTVVNLILFVHNGVPHFSVRHVSHLNQYPSAHHQGILFPVESPTWRMNPELRAYIFPQAHPYDYTDTGAYLGAEAILEVGDGVARLIAVEPYREPSPHREWGPATKEIVGLFTW